MSVLATISGAALLAWLYLLCCHGRFWRADQRIESAALLDDPPHWPTVTVVMPARDEEGQVGRALTSLDAQDYPGPLDLILANDHSRDATVAEASGAVRRHQLTIADARDLPPGWSGKMWAVSEGLALVAARDNAPDYVLLTDADIAHRPESLRLLVKRAEAEQRDCVSVMAKLAIGDFWEKLLIPAFVFFFQKLYPFPRVNDPGDAMGAAAGGCLLVRYGALTEIGGVVAVKDALIDDVALARAIQHRGLAPAPIWLGLGDTAVSIRPYLGLNGVWRMVRRTAFTQLDHRAVLLVGTLLGMALLYLAGPALVLSVAWHGDATAAALGGLAWAAMSLAFAPTLGLYGISSLFAVFLPLAGILYSGMTFDSALQYWRGRGGAWKGRYQAPAG